MYIYIFYELKYNKTKDIRTKSAHITNENFIIGRNLFCSCLAQYSVQGIKNFIINKIVKSLQCKNVYMINNKNLLI